MQPLRLNNVYSNHKLTVHRHRPRSLTPSGNGLTLYDTKERLIARATMKNSVYPLILPIVYPDFDLVAGEADAVVLNEELHEHLEHGDEHRLTAFSIWEKSDAIGVYDCHHRMGYRNMKDYRWHGK